MLPTIVVHTDDVHDPATGIAGSCGVSTVDVCTSNTPTIALLHVAASLAARFIGASQLHSCMQGLAEFHFRCCL